MTALEKIRSWVATFHGFCTLSDFQVDYTDQALPDNGSIAPSGLVEVERRWDITGTATVTNQLNFTIYCVFAKPPGDDMGATMNADWVMGFQEWAQEQSVRGLAPTFGDIPHEEKIAAQNGGLYAAGPDGTATYMVQLSVRFKKIYEVKNKWLT